MAERESMRSIELYDMIRRFPDYRVVGDTGDSNTCIPLQFTYHDDSLAFFTDLTATQFHKHALCEEVLDLVGDVGEGILEGPVLFNAYPGDSWKNAVTCHRVTRDDSAKWLRIHFE